MFTIPCGALETLILFLKVFIKQNLYLQKVTAKYY